MTEAAPLRLYATFRTTPDLLALYRRKDLAGLSRFTTRLLAAARDRRVITAPQAAASQGLPDLQAVSAPSLDWDPAFVPLRNTEGRRAVAPDSAPAELVVAYTVPNRAAARLFSDIISMHREVPLDAQGNAFRGAGADPGGSVAEHWSPAGGDDAFSHRLRARQTIRADALANHGLRGQGVNVVIIDEGLNKDALPPQNWGGGLDHFLDAGLIQPVGAAPRTSHGMMIARNVLDFAPEARLYDVPVIPSGHPPPLPVFVSSVQAAWTSLLGEIQQRRALPPWSGPWILINAWGIFETDTDPLSSYTRNTEPGGHPMINLITHAVDQLRLDAIFAAGNCGQFCPDARCGGMDRGPGHSIWGASAHSRVITVGAVRADETWIGYSSQGPGPDLLSRFKPDLCAPSHFRENYDAAMLSSGTSTACAMVGGVVAALRSNPQWQQAGVTPDTLRAALTGSARKPHGPAGWDARLGFGIIDVGATIGALPP